ncbi:MAG: non-hydrolyzing UDP-N-acetylglucosamine 2-epimerase [Candidatus Kapaibacteriales bacterium]
MKIISVVGARPNFMKIAPIHRALRKYSSEIQHMLCHTGQHYDYSMSEAFFKDLELPEPNFFLGAGSGTHGEQTGKILIEFEKVCYRESPDLVIVVGDVNSTIAATLSAVKLGIRTGHVEAGLRSFDRSMPEEINRIATDSISDFLFVTEQSGIDNLRREGHSEEKIFYVGNTMIDSLTFVLPKIEQSQIVQELSLAPIQFALMTLHRPSNVDLPQQLSMLIDVMEYISQRIPLVFPIHPRTKKNIYEFGLDSKFHRIKNLKVTQPLSYIDFVALMKNSMFVLTDSGGIQEETTFLKIPCLTLRTTTERPITCEIGSNILVTPQKDNIISAIDKIFEGNNKEYQIPPLWDGKAGERIVDIINSIFLNH